MSEKPNNDGESTQEARSSSQPKQNSLRGTLALGAGAILLAGTAISTYPTNTPLEHRARLNNIIIHALAGEREPFHVNPEAAPSNLIITIRGKAHRVISPTKPNGTFIETKDVLLKSEDDKCLVADGNPETPIEEVDCPPNI